ncbi:MarR family winged helix-turn-helix transcriptional regulator [Patescibacteria group bacterium]|nr:MarR family winged helix-turn-helix transcriptional regulator [Patescibacteria group bacterium]
MPDLHPNTTDEEKFFLALSRCYTLSRKLGEKALRPMGVTIAEYNLLRVVENTPGIQARDAQKRFYATAPSISQLIRGVERKKLIKRVHDKDDARARPLFLTPKGKTTVEKARQTLEKAISTLNPAPSSLGSTVKDLTLLISSLSSSLY